MTFHNGIKMGTIGTESPYPGPYFAPSAKRLNEKKPGREKVAMPNKGRANIGKFSNGKSAGQFGDAIARILTMARESDVMLFDRMDDEVFRILGVRYQLPEVLR